MRVITQTEIDDLIIKAQQSQRRRTILRLHEHEEPVQRMVNAVLPDSYVRPHKHQDPDKTELFNILKGRVACLRFDYIGEVTDVFILDAEGSGQIVDIPPRTFHTIIALQPSALLEIIQGPYVAATHKQFASWAPPEDSAKSADYLMYLESIVHNWRIRT